MQDIYDNSRWESNALSDYYSYLSSINSFDKDGSSDLVNSNEDREHYQKFKNDIDPDSNTQNTVLYLIFHNMI